MYFRIYRVFARATVLNRFKSQRRFNVIKLYLAVIFNRNRNGNEAKRSETIGRKRSDIEAKFIIYQTPDNVSTLIILNTENGT